MARSSGPLLACDGRRVAIGQRGAVPSAEAAQQVPSAAPGTLGTMSHFGLARKDCVGTARNTTSKVWFTVAGGVLSDVYFPTIDTTNIETVQYIVTDGSTFTDLQTATPPTPSSRWTTADGVPGQQHRQNGRYTPIRDYSPMPERNSVAMETTLKPARGEKNLVDLRSNGRHGQRQRRWWRTPSARTWARTTRSSTPRRGPPVPASIDTETSTIAANPRLMPRRSTSRRWADRPLTIAVKGVAMRTRASDGLVQTLQRSAA